MRVEEIMSRKVVSCSEDATLDEAVRSMWEHDVGFVPVLGSGGKVVGVVTDRDACIACWFQGRTLREIQVRSVMSERLATCHPNSSLDEAQLIMSEYQVHRLPVLSPGGQVLGVLSIDDLARHAAGKADETLEQEVALTLGAICQPRPPEQAVPIS